MRNVVRTIIILLAVSMMATGCDFFRSLAGRPTSALVEAKRKAMLRELEAKAVVPVDTAAETPVASVPKESVEKSAGHDAPWATDGKKRFYVVIASFSSEENARKCVDKMKERGYQGELLGFKGGYTGVGICGTDDEQEAKESLREVKRQDFCPEGVWIIDRNKR